MLLNIKNTFAFVCVLLLFSFLPNNIKAQLIIKDNYANYQTKEIIQKYFSNSSIIINSATFYGDTKHSFGTFTGGIASNLGFNEGIVISNGNVSEIPGNANDTLNGELGLLGFPALNALLYPSTSYDASVISINFTPLTDTIRFRYIFASEEFLPFNELPKDIFGIFISGEAYNNKNIALFPGTTTEIRVDSLTGSSYNQYYRSNTGGSAFKFNGYTTVLTAICPVEHCKTYTLDIAIGDARNYKFDSGLFLEAGSFSSTHYAVAVKGNNGDNGMTEKCGTASFIFTRDTVTSTPFRLDFEIAGTATNGIDYVDSLGGNMPNFIVFQPNQKQAKINIKAIPNDGSEPTETIVVKLTGAGFSQCISDTVKATLLLKNTDDLNVKAFGDTTVCNESGDKPILSAIITGGVKPFKVYWLESNTTDTTGITPQGEISEIMLPEYNPKDEKPFYLYHAIVIDSCESEFISNDVKIFIKCPIKTTNVITPNGDGYNDKFIVKHLIEYPNSQLVILNRWGNKVFETNNYQNDWDGKNFADGVYYFILKLPDGSKYQGSITIIR